MVHINKGRLFRIDSEWAEELKKIRERTKDLSKYVTVEYSPDLEVRFLSYEAERAVDSDLAEEIFRLLKWVRNLRKPYLLSRDGIQEVENVGLVVYLSSEGVSYSVSADGKEFPLLERRESFFVLDGRILSDLSRILDSLLKDFSF